MLRESDVVVGNNVTLAAIEEPCITDVLREGVVVVGNSLALVTVTDDLCLAVEMWKSNIRMGRLTTTHHQFHI